MFRMAITDIRISPLKTFLTSLSMFVGIIALVSGMLAGSLGGKTLQAMTEQTEGYATTYAVMFDGANFSDQEKTKTFLQRLDERYKIAIKTHINEEVSVYRLNKLEDLSKEGLIKNTTLIDEIFLVNKNLKEVFNLPMTSGKWFNPNMDNPSLNVVLNKKARQELPDKKIALLSSNSLTPTPFNVIGIVNDDGSMARLYLNIEELLAIAPNQMDTPIDTLYWYNDTNISEAGMKRHISDILYDTVGGEVTQLMPASTADSMAEVYFYLQMGLTIIAALLLFISVLGQINIGLASIEQRMHELVIRRALGASKRSIFSLVLSSSLLIATIVSAAAIGISFVVVNVIQAMLIEPDSAVGSLDYPVSAAIIAVITSFATAIIGGIIPAKKAAKLEPALALR